MAKITVWSKQHENVWKVLQETGRYTVKREYIIKDLKEHSELVLDTYEWLVKNGPDYGNKPADVEFPVWVSFRQDATMLPEKGRVILELEIEESLITRVNFTKWGMILNYSYIPADKADEKRHKELLEAYGSATRRRICRSSIRRSNGKSGRAGRGFLMMTSRSEVMDVMETSGRCEENG